MQRDEITAAEWYERPVFGHAVMLKIVGITNARVQLWFQRNYLTKRTHKDAPGRGKRRKYSPGEVLFLAYVRTLADVGLQVNWAANLADGLFPTLWGDVASDIANLLRGSIDPYTSPRVFEVIRHDDGYPAVEADPGSYITNHSIDAATVINLTRFVNVTMGRIRAND